MPITRSKGRPAAEAWTVDAGEGASTSTPPVRHQLPPRSPSSAADSADPPAPPPPAAPPRTPRGPSPTTVKKVTPLDRKGDIEAEGDSVRTLRPSGRVATRSIEDSDRRQEPRKDRDQRTVVSSRSNRKVLKARQEILKIKLQLAELELQKAEEEVDSDDYDEDGQSKAEYVRSWLEEAPEPHPDPEPIEATDGRGNTEWAANIGGIEYRESGPDSNQHKQEDGPPEVEESSTNRKEGGYLKPFITELTSAIAALAEKKPLDFGYTSPHPAVSKVVMTLPTFDGAHTEWLSFKAIYDTTKKYFNDVENTARLRKSLKGRALEAVNSELIGNAKPEDIMMELELQFGRPDSIAQAESDRLKNLPRCGESPRDICTFASKVRSGVITLQALKKGHYLLNAELLRVLSEKLPSSLRVHWYRAYNEKYLAIPSITNFSEFVTEQARFCSAFAPAETAKEPQQARRNIQRTHTTTESKQNGSSHSTESARCRICSKEGHRGADCNQFQSANADKRWELARMHKLCYRCLRNRVSGHTCKARKCGINGCPATHNQLLHFKKKAEEKQKSEAPVPAETVASSSCTTKVQAYLKIVPVQLVGPGGEVSTFALLDDGSTISLIDEDIAQKVGAEGKSEPFTIRAIGDTAIDMPASRRVDVVLRSRSGSEASLNARTVPALQLTPQSVTVEAIQDCDHLKDIANCLTYETGVPKILIGQDNWHLLIAKMIRRGPRNQPVASLTTMGWVLHGAHTRSMNHPVHFVNQMSKEDNIENQLKEYFALESLIVNPQRPSSDPEKKAQEILQKNTKQLEDGHIETALLWKTEDFSMPDSYENAFKRLASIEKKLDRNPNLKSKYDEQMNSLVQKGYAEEAPQKTTPGKTWYLPHFDVHNAMKPEKLRIVHDAAAKTKGMSLNDYLLTGPDLLQSLPGVMMRFRRHPYAVKADIAEMFMQVKVREEDRDALRYLWRGDRREGAPKEFRMKSIIFGAASSPCTAIFAKNWNAQRHASEHPEAVEAIVDCHYMDDYLDSYRTEEEALRIATEVRDIHREARFELKKWVSNSTKIVDVLEPDQRPAEAVNLVGKEQEEKTLGLIWQPSTDELSFNLKLTRLPDNLLSKEAPTKREALKIVMSLYDPLGLVSPVTVRAKQILQEAWRLGTDWDEQLNEELAKQWTAWIRQLEKLKLVNIPRCYPGYSQAHSLQLHVFCDASEAAYSAAVYWRAATEDKVNVSLVMAKARVAPLKVVSIPRLELQAAVMGCRIAAAVVQEHKVKPEAVIYWTDSKTVLTWIRKGARVYKPFVAHRLAAIEEYSKVEDWRWVPTKSNIADAATRNVPVDFDSRHEWFTGPAFLHEDPSDWPTEKPIATEETGEEKTTIVSQTCHIEQKISSSVPDPNRFSKWERLLRSTARVLQFIALCRKPKEQQVLYKRTLRNPEKDPDWRRNRTNTKTSQKIDTGLAALRPAPEPAFVYLPAEHIRDAEDLLVKAVQEDSFGAELRDLRRGRDVARNSRLHSLPVELKNGVINLRSRIAATEDVPEKTKTPPILDGGHRITQLYLEWTHRSLHHSGTELVVNEVRQHYWVLKLRPTVKQLIQSCLQCRIRKAQPPEPATGDLPRARLAHHERPFTYTGLDYFGPLSVTVGRQHQKRYVALFTCLTSRAVHLEIAATLSADSAILALRRFAARRGCPAEIYSDNGTNMHGADREMREAVKNEASRRGIVWRFITPSAPFMGGAWERLVRCVKTTLYTVLHDKHPHEEVLSTLLCEVEYTVNSRPLTHVSVNAEDDEAITPNHILLGGSSRLPSLGEFSEADIDSKKHWRRAQILADLFWRRWVREYLPELQYRREPHGTAHRFELGDPVLIADGNLPRNTWPRGRIVAVYPGADGQIRTAEVQTAAGVLKRPTKKLVPLPK